MYSKKNSIFAGIMREARYYIVAGHGFCVEAEAEDFLDKRSGTADNKLMENYEPFRVEGCEALFNLTVGQGDDINYVEELRQEEEGQIIICGKRRISNAPEQAVFEFIWEGVTAGWLVAEPDYHQATLVIAGDKYRKLAIDNALMVMYALATADKGTVLFHAAVVSHEGRGYMFLGASGTGKSTHARLWLQHIEGTELVNDDNPVVRDGVVYGSPWSGKTPCYRNVSYPLGGIVLLSQAPYNKITRLGGLQAYAALVPSISGKRWDARIADGLHETENELTSSVPIWHLECLPDEEAARLCQTTIS